jgi:hypothetical protein
VKIWAQFYLLEASLLQFGSGEEILFAQIAIIPLLLWVVVVVIVVLLLLCVDVVAIVPVASLRTKAVRNSPYPRVRENLSPVGYFACKVCITFAFSSLQNINACH